MWSLTFSPFFTEIQWLLFSSWSFSYGTMWHHHFLLWVFSIIKCFCPSFSFHECGSYTLTPSSLENDGPHPEWSSFVSLSVGRENVKLMFCVAVKDKRTRHCLITLWFRENLCKILLMLFIFLPGFFFFFKPWAMQYCWQLSYMENKMCCKLLLINGLEVSFAKQETQNYVNSMEETSHLLFP